MGCNMTELWYDGFGGVVITVDDSSVTVPEKDQADLLQIMTDGFCAICLSEIPQYSKLCCSCLSDIIQYHKNHHACLQ